MKLGTRLAVALLKRSTLPLEDRTLLIGMIIENIGAAPLSAMVTQNDVGALMIGGREITVDQAVKIREGARTLLDNVVERLVNEQVKYQAFTFGISSSTSLEHLYFAKAALWWGQEREKILQLLAQKEL